MPAPPPSRRRTPVPSRPPRPHRPLRRGPEVRRGRRRAAVVLALPLLVVLGAIALRVAYSGRALPGTTLAGAAVAGQSRSALGERLARQAAGPVTISASGVGLQTSPARAGYVLDVAATVERVMRAGRDGALAGLAATVTGLFSDRDVRPVDHVQDRAVRATARTFASRADRAADPGGIVVDPDTLRVTVRAARAGRVVDRSALAADLPRVLRAGRTTVRAAFRAEPVAGVARVRAVGRAAAAYLREPLTLTGAGPPVRVAPRGLAPLLRLQAPAGDRTTVRLGADPAATAALVAGVAADRDRPAREARLTAPGRALVFDAKGAASWRPRRARVRVTQAPRSGLTVRRQAAAAAIAAAVRAGRHDVVLPLARARPRVTAQAARRVTSLIGTFTTRYQPGQPRVTNIRTMARTVDGTLIPVAGQFSLNGIVGPRTSRGGYVKAPFIADGRIVPSIGGGVSQFSTTTYNAAYFAGLRLDSHQPHSEYISRYPPGREATLDYPGIDLKWTNDTQAPILVRTFSDATSLTVSLYGDNGGRLVRSRPGPRRPVPGRDFAITVVRTVRYPDGRMTHEPFTTTYDPPPPAG